MTSACLHLDTIGCPLQITGDVLGRSLYFRTNRRFSPDGGWKLYYGDGGLEATYWAGPVAEGDDVVESDFHMACHFIGRYFEVDEWAIFEALDLTTGTGQCDRCTAVLAIGAAR